MDNTKVNTNSGKVSSRITWQGVEVSGPRGKVEVKITGDEIEATPKDSFIQGVFKGAAITVVGASYPLFTMFYKGIQGKKKASSAVSAVSWEPDAVAKIEAGSKGDLVGTLKGLAHGVVDCLAIGTLLLVCKSLGGPVGVALGAVVGGGVYNLLKDGIRKGIKELYNSMKDDIKETMEKTKVEDNTKEKAEDNTK